MFGGAYHAGGGGEGRKAVSSYCTLYLNLGVEEEVGPKPSHRAGKGMPHSKTLESTRAGIMGGVESR